MQQFLYIGWVYILSGLAEKVCVAFSNNDGCVMSRSDKAKALFIKMGMAVFEIFGMFEKNHFKAAYEDTDQATAFFFALVAPKFRMGKSLAQSMIIFIIKY